MPPLHSIVALASMDDKIARRMDQAIGEELRIVRRERRLTQKQLADQIGLTFQQIQKYEKGVNRISISCACRLAPALGLTPATLLVRLSQSTNSILQEMNYQIPLGTRPPALDVALSGIQNKAVRQSLTGLIRRLTTAGGVSNGASKS